MTDPANTHEVDELKVGHSATGQEHLDGTLLAVSEPGIRVFMLYFMTAFGKVVLKLWQGAQVAGERMYQYIEWQCFKRV